MAMKSEIEVALQAHAAWRQHFKDILNGRSTFDLNEIKASDQCVLGKWLINEGKRMIPVELHNEIFRVHQDFHKIASEIIQKIKDKRYVEAHEDISLEGPLNLTSIKLKSLLVKLSFKEPPAEPVVAIENEKSSNAQEKIDPSLFTMKQSVPEAKEK